MAVALAFMQVDAFVSGTYSISFMRFAGIPLATTATILLLSRIFKVPGVILSGPLADLFKRKTVAYAAVAITTLLSYAFVLALHRWYYMPIVYGLYCVAAVLSLLLIRETRDLTMEDLNGQVSPKSQVVHRKGSLL